MATTVRIGTQTHTKLKELADASGESMSAVLDKAVEIYRRERFLQEVNRAYASLRDDKEAWQDELEERRVWDVTLADGQVPEGVHQEPEGEGSGQCGHGNESGCMGLSGRCGHEKTRRRDSPAGCSSSK